MPACGMSLFTGAGRALLEAAQNEGSSVCATVTRAFRKQGTPTSCGVCCAVIAFNALQLARAPRSEIMSKGAVSANDFRRGAAALRELDGDMVLEREVRNRCGELIPGADQDVLDTHGLTLRQVAKLCSSLFEGAGYVRTYTCDHGHTIEDLRHTCRAWMSSTAEGSPSLIIANMYMGDSSKGGLGSVSTCVRRATSSLLVRKPAARNP